MSLTVQYSEGWILKGLQNLVKKPTKPLERLRPPLEESGSVSDPLMEKWRSTIRNLEGDFSAAVFKFIFNNTESVLGFLQHLKLV